MFHRHRLIVTLVAAFYCNALADAQCEYDVTVIQPPPCSFWGPPTTYGRGINEMGHVAGSRWQCGSLWTNDAAFLWTPESGIGGMNLARRIQPDRAPDPSRDGLLDQHLWLSSPVEREPPIKSHVGRRGLGLDRRLLTHLGDNIAGIRDGDFASIFQDDHRVSRGDARHLAPPLIPGVLVD